MKKIGKIIIVMMMLISGFSLIINVEAQILNTTIIVDDEGDGDYNSIQDAINNAQSGDTIEVYSGTYYEHVIINKKVNLVGINKEYGLGNDKGLPVINGTNFGGQYSVVEINADNCKLSGFQLEKSNIAMIKIISNNNNISYNQISGHHYYDLYAILIDGSINNNVNNNSIHGTLHGIALINESRANTITANYFNSSYRGVYGEISQDTVINNNYFFGGMYGIYLDHCKGYEIIKNHFNWSTKPITLRNTYNNDIENNNFINYRFHVGIYWSSFWRIHYPPPFPPINNRFKGNYWDEWAIPVPIPILKFLWIPYYAAPFGIPYGFTFDWRTTQEPNDIPNMKML